MYSANCHFIINETEDYIHISNSLEFSSKQVEQLSFNNVIEIDICFKAVEHEAVFFCEIAFCLQHLTFISQLQNT